MIDWLVFNAYFNSISAISWHEQTWCIRTLEDPNKDDQKKWDKRTKQQSLKNYTKHLRLIYMNPIKNQGCT